jgi:nucleoside-diphosphate-sugar epimerase
MRILFIGGTGNISSSCSRAVLAAGHHLSILTRGQRATVPGLERAHWIQADINEEASVEAVLASTTFDVVVDFIAYSVAHVERDLRLFASRCSQYVFISSASCYTKPMPIPVSESWPVGNPLWAYSQAKVACEQRLWQARDAGVGVTVVRPSHTYATILPLAIAGGGWTGCARMLAGQPLLLPGDGTSIWTVTHADDFAIGLLGLLGNPAALGDHFHITGDELLTWEGIHRETAAALGVEPILRTMTSADLIRLHPDMEGSMLGDKSHSAVFDNRKIKALVPAFQQRVPFALGIRRTIAWFQADPTRMTIDERANARIDALCAGR